MKGGNMANKTLRTVVRSAFLFFLILYPAIKVYPVDLRFANLADSVIVPDATRVQLVPEKFISSDGTKWGAILDGESKIPRMIFSSEDLAGGGDPAQVATAFINDNMASFVEDGTVQRFSKPDSMLMSPGTKHFFYNQMIGGLPVFNGTMAVHVSNSGKIELVNNDLSPVAVTDHAFKYPDLDFQEAVRIASLRIAPSIPYAKPTAKIGYLKLRDRLIKVIRVTYPVKNPRADWLFDIESRSGAIIRKINVLRTFDGMGFVQSPNPLDSPQRQLVNLSDIIEPKDGQPCILNGRYFNVTSTLFGRAQESQCTFDYSYIFDNVAKNEAQDSNPHFEEVMAYFHMEAFRKYYRDQGFQLFTSYKINVDAHGTICDDSWYSSMTREIVFGDGGANDASDGDIIIHELTHATIDFIKPNLLGSTGEVRALHEGFADYFAASFFNDPCIAQWDTPNYSNQQCMKKDEQAPDYAGKACLRRTDTNKHYPEDLTGLEHDDGEIWSSALWTIRGKMLETQGLNASDLANRMIMKGIYYLPDGDISFKQAAISIITSDINLTGGANRRLIEAVFLDSGILKAEDINIIDDKGLENPFS
jgi:Zn-dependent metalloprotease